MDDEGNDAAGIEDHPHGFRLASDGACGLAVKRAVIAARVLRFDLECLAAMRPGQLVAPGKAQGELMRHAPFSLFSFSRVLGIFISDIGDSKKRLQLPGTKRRSRW